MIYELTTFTIGLGTAKAVNEGLAATVDKHSLLGVWHADIGQLNRCVMLRQFEDFEHLLAAREKTLAETNPFGCGDAIKEMTFDSYKPFPFCGPVTPGKYGAVYEIRTYKLKHGGIPKTIAAWQAAVPAREKLSPLSLAMYALDGAPRFTHIWPYADTNDRAKNRGDAVAQGIWPPQGGPQWLTGDMTSMIGIPAAISPLA